jgi:hypothetical protein
MVKPAVLAGVALLALGMNSANAQGWGGGMGWHGGFGGWHGGGWRGNWGHHRGGGFGVGLISGLALGSLASAPAYGYPAYRYAPAYYGEDDYYDAPVYRPRVVVEKVVYVRPVYRPYRVHRTRVVYAYPRPYHRYRPNVW